MLPIDIDRAAAKTNSQCIEYPCGFPYLTNTQPGCSSGKAIRPITAVTAISSGLLTLKRNRTARLPIPTSTVSQSPIAILPSKKARAEDRADGGRIGALYKSFDIRIGAVPDQDRSDNQNQQERGKKYTDGRDERAPEPGHEIAYKGGGDDDGTGADHADGHRHQKLASVEPAGLLHQPLFEKGHNDETAAESEASGFEKEGKQPPENVEVCRLCGDAERRERHQRLRRRLAAAQQRAVVQDADN